MKITELVQVEFRYGLNVHKVVWVNCSWNLRPGDRVEFEGSGLMWDVVKVYDTRVESGQLRKKWGLDLPRSQRTEA